MGERVKLVDPATGTDYRAGGGDVDANGNAGAVLYDGAGGEVDMAAMVTAIGAPDDAAWNGTDPDATVISLLKAIATNTAP